MNLIEIFQYGFIVRAFIAGVIIACIAPMVGTFLVVRRYSLLADTLAHVALAGVAIGLIFQGQPIIISVIFTVLASIGIEYLRKSGKFFAESVLAIFLSGSLALAVVLISIADGFNVDLFSYLFGSITTVSASDIVVISILGAVVFFSVLFMYKYLFFISFDEEVARVRGIRVSALNFALVVMAAVTIAISMRIVGVLLIGALMVIPVLTAMQFARSFKQTFVYAIFVSLLAVVFGIYFSYYLDLATGGTIVVTAIFLFLVSLVLKMKKS